jgi:hypothetical protein
MAVQFKAYSATASQWASAASHLETRGEWKVYRVDGVRYVALKSGTSGHIYAVKASGNGCSCRWYQSTWQQCSHMLAIDLDAMEDELREDAARDAVIEAERLTRIDDDGAIDLAFAALATGKRGDSAGAAIIKRYEDLWPEED